MVFQNSAGPDSVKLLFNSMYVYTVSSKDVDMIKLYIHTYIMSVFPKGVGRPH